MLDKYIGMESRLVQAFLCPILKMMSITEIMHWASSAMICFFLCHIFSSSHLRNSIGQFYFKGRRIPLHMLPLTSHYDLLGQMDIQEWDPLKLKPLDMLCTRWEASGDTVGENGAGDLVSSFLTFCAVTKSYFFF